MFVSSLVIVVGGIALLLALQMRRALGAGRGTALAGLLLLSFGVAWGALEWTHRSEPPLPEDMTASQPITAETCLKCHEGHYNSWIHTYHRTMTREATPEYVKADFNLATHTYDGVTSTMTRLENRFFIETVDPAWEVPVAEGQIPRDKAGPPQTRLFTVDRIVGSHWFQQMLTRDEHGRYLRLPLAYHLVENQWIHVNGAFLAPNPKSFFGKTAVWNETCVFCHNTRPTKNPAPLPGQMPSYRTEVGELGISCEACHGAGERHVRSHQNPARRLAQRYSLQPDPTIVNPARLPIKQADDICARCHGGTIPRHKEWNPITFADPYLAGRELRRFWYVPFSEAEQKVNVKGIDTSPASPPRPEPLDGRFWGDGTPLTTAVEYQGIALSACYQNGQGKMSCLTCHSMHNADRNHQVKDGMRTNEACYGCHESYRTKLVEHTHHSAGSSGSSCLNCHMPHQVYSLLDIHRSHRISIPRVKDSLKTGKPHACNLCHLDKSLGWTQDQLSKWYGTKPEPLSVDEQKLATGLLELFQGDGRTRAVMAGAFTWPPAQQTSGTDWPARVLMRTLEHERYEAVRYSAHKALRSLYGDRARVYHYQGTPAERAAQLRTMRSNLETLPRLDPQRYPYLPLTPAGLVSDEVFDRLLRTRKDPDVIINE